MQNSLLPSSSMLTPWDEIEMGLYAGAPADVILSIVGDLRPRLQTTRIEFFGNAARQLFICEDKKGRPSSVCMTEIEIETRTDTKPTLDDMLSRITLVSCTIYPAGGEHDASTVAFSMNPSSPLHMFAFFDSPPEPYQCPWTTDGVWPVPRIISSLRHYDGGFLTRWVLPLPITHGLRTGMMSRPAGERFVFKLNSTLRQETVTMVLSYLPLFSTYRSSQFLHIPCTDIDFLSAEEVLCSRVEGDDHQYTTIRVHIMEQMYPVSAVFLALSTHLPVSITNVPFSLVVYYKHGVIGIFPRSPPPADAIDHTGAETEILKVNGYGQVRPTDRCIIRPGSPIDIDILVPVREREEEEGERKLSVSVALAVPLFRTYRDPLHHFRKPLEATEVSRVLQISDTE